MVCFCTNKHGARVGACLTTRGLFGSCFVWFGFGCGHRYVWESHKDEATMADMAIFGIGAAVNCDHGLVNVDRSSPETTWSERITGGQEHPGAGASTVYHNVYGFATQDIQPGYVVRVS